ncbi:hypothetical protein FCL40_18130 [Ferrimonas sediminicola]|uniref:Resolvase/invertase-type recombinase catalytic domain-containing protein n=1 Tax=Ferrimonas sediminicola TaxID=2569538 RepID=A0A4U1B6V8_9GAMM|nr:hypothetical protein FCL40_18130 [Ferrimonas sediminicola]
MATLPPKAVSGIIKPLHTDAGVSVESLDLRGVDLTSPAGKLQLTVLAAVAEMEKGRIVERTKEGLARA